MIRFFCAVLRRSVPRRSVPRLIALAVFTLLAPPITLPLSAMSPTATEPSFVRNDGQWPTEVLFRARTSPETAIEVRAEALVMVGVDRERALGSAVHFTFPGGVLSGAIGGCARSDRAHYFLGNDRSCWRSDVPRFTTLWVASVWAGIDLRLRFDAGRPQFDWVLAP